MTMGGAIKSIQRMDKLTASSVFTRPNAVTRNARGSKRLTYRRLIMKKLGLLALCIAALGVVGCADPCGDLQSDVCDKCTGTDLVSTASKASCEAVVNLDDSDACDAAMDLYPACK